MVCHDLQQIGRVERVNGVLSVCVLSVGRGGRGGCQSPSMLCGVRVCVCVCTRADMFTRASERMNAGHTSPLLHHPSFCRGRQRRVRVWAPKSSKVVILTNRPPHTHTHTFMHARAHTHIHAHTHTRRRSRRCRSVPDWPFRPNNSHRINIRHIFRSSAE